MGGSREQEGFRVGGLLDVREPDRAPRRAVGDPHTLGGVVGVIRDERDPTPLEDEVVRTFERPAVGREGDRGAGTGAVAPPEPAAAGGGAGREKKTPAPAGA